MSQNASSIRERFRFQSAALGPDAEPLHVLRFSGTEGFSQLFSFDVRLATRQKDLDTGAILANPAVRSLIRQGKYNQLVSVMLSQQAVGMQTLAMDAQRLWQAGRIDGAVCDKLCKQ